MTGRKSSLKITPSPAHVGDTASVEWSGAPAGSCRIEVVESEVIQSFTVPTENGVKNNWFMYLTNGIKTFKMIHSDGSILDTDEVRVDP